MRPTLFAAATLTIACVLCSLDPKPVEAAGPRSRTASGDELAFPFSTVADFGPADRTDSTGADLRSNAYDRVERDVSAVDAKEQGAKETADSASQDEQSAEAESDASPPTDADLPSLSPRMQALRDRVRATLGYYHQKQLNTRDHNPWQVMHSIVAYGASSNLNRNGPSGQPVNAICWLCWNGDCNGSRILEVNNGKVTARKGVSVQGHPGQFLAILAQSCVATSCPIKVGEERFTLADLIESEKLGCQAGTELTFKLISFSYYLDIDEQWKNYAGQDWSIDRLVKEELAQPILGAPCGGSHRLMGLAYAVRKREQSGLPISGEFRRAKKFLDDYHRYTFKKLQNPDGSFSTEWFNGPGARTDLGRRIQTSGHILEWLSYSLPADMLEDPRVVKAVDYLSGVLLGGKNQEWEIGPLGHALHSLAIYDSRVFKPHDGSEPATSLAESKPEHDTDVASEVLISDEETTKPELMETTAPLRVTRLDSRPLDTRPKPPRPPQ